MDSKESLMQYLIRERYLKTPRIIEAFRVVDRADFVLPEEKAHAYDNAPRAIGFGQTISQPLTVAFLLELLQPEHGDHILDIGSGSGWTSTLLAHLVGPAGKVYAVERIPELYLLGKKNAEKYDVGAHAHFSCCDGMGGLHDRAPFDKILSSAAASGTIPEEWRKQLKVGGRIVAPVGNSIWLLIKKSETEWEEKKFPGFAFVPLVDEKNKELRIKNQGNKKRWQNFFIFLASCFLLLASGYELLLPHTAYSGMKTITIAPGMGSRQIADLLKQQGFVHSKWSFETYISVLGEASNLKPGTYTFGQQSIPEIARILIKGNTNERILTIPEGWTRQDIADYLDEEDPRQGALFLEQTDAVHARLYADRFSFLTAVSQLNLEGFLFPDTYRVHEGTSTDELVLKMLQNFDKKLTPDLRAEIMQQHKSLYEVLILASLIEKEVRSDSDRAVVSGILWKRLKLGIPLQVDATLLYAKKQESRISAEGGSASGGKNQGTTEITAEDKKINSPYNTYKYRGLPPGPIANPGMSSIRAAIFPRSSPYLYYLSTSDGSIIFSETLDEHNTAKAKYLK